MAFFDRSRVAILIAGLGFAFAIFVALVPLTSEGLSLSEGAIASRTVRAPRDIAFVSEALTSRRQDEAAAAVPETLRHNPSIALSQQDQLSVRLSRIAAILADESLAPASRRDAIGRIEESGLSTESLALLSSLPPFAFEPAETEARKALTAVFAQSLAADLIQETRERAASYVGPAVADRATIALITDLIRPLIVTNLVLHAEDTEAARAAARAGVAPVQVSYARSQVIVERDAPVTAEAREALIEGGLLSGRWEAEVIGASAILATLGAVAILAGVRAFRPKASGRQLLAIGLAIALPIFVMKVYLPFILPDDQRYFLAYAVPLAAAAMVLAGLVGAEIALLAAGLIALLAAFAAVLLFDVTFVGIAGTLDVIRVALVTALSGAGGVFAVRNAERLSHFLLGGLVVGLTVLAVLSATWLIDPAREAADLAWILLAASANGGLSAFLAAGIFVTLAPLFGVTTRLQLLEMSQLSQPLLLRLQDEAPSTFQHSVIVANLAEKGAHVIGADALLARVGCYYHDIGKLARPGFFIENQLGGDNPHDALDPTDSARIIADHVNDGLALAAQSKLPARVAAFIPEHHGTRTVAYFYRLAAAAADVDQDAFRYPGPKPQSRETAIAMLADSCEAAVRASPDHSAERIDSIVDEIYTERLTEGQLDESDLTLRNIRMLADSFKATLRAIYHPRIEYPAPSEAELLLRRQPFRRFSHR